MPRSGEAVRRRLQVAALELYRKHGYDHTTTAQIAARAKVTERTFFRHFADKREVLFEGEAALKALMVRAIAEAPAELPPLLLLQRAFRAAVPMIEANRGFSEPRAEVIAVTPALHERALAKVAALNQALATALRARGVADRAAALATQIGMAAFHQAATAWRDSAKKLDALIVRAFDDVHELTGARPPSRTRT